MLPNQPEQKPPGVLEQGLGELLASALGVQEGQAEWWGFSLQKHSQRGTKITICKKSTAVLFVVAKDWAL